MTCSLMAAEVHVVLMTDLAIKCGSEAAGILVIYKSENCTKKKRDLRSAAGRNRLLFFLLCTLCFAIGSIHTGCRE